MSGFLNWDSDGRLWPHREASCFVDAGGLRWRVERMGSGPIALLLHGTGASAHSWRDVAPLLAADFSVIAMDLPGHGFTRGRPKGGLSLDGMARSIESLREAVGGMPSIVVGHSAGAAIALRHAMLTGHDAPIFGFNPALMPFPGLAARLFPAMAKMLFVNPLAPRIFARMARVPGETGRFLHRSTGSRTDAAGLRCYEILLGNRRHCEGALGMMANWDLERLAAQLPSVTNCVMLMTSQGDIAVPRESVERAAALIPECALDVWDDLGHLAHEEQPAMAAERIRAFARKSVAAKRE
jgi:magnesium chelatase accessory protein